jgi:hypothetical protein
VNKEPGVAQVYDPVALSDFRSKLSSIKARRNEIGWYPHDIMHNFSIIGDFGGREALGDVAGKRILDIGAADGDSAFYLEDRGAEVTILDNVSTNYNDCQGIKILQRELGSSTRLLEMDVDFAESIPGQYDLTLFLGMGYHVRNPMLILSNLALASEYMVFSTTMFLELNGVDVSGVALAYLWETREANNDPTNFWNFTPEGLRRLVKRCGWRVIAEHQYGGGEAPHGDGRMFMYCQRVPHYAGIKHHHDF